ncbi:MAG TPA: Maf family protein [Tepidisphaeraceae bacterium]|nr:Maf family protein [Tepidisphaeraceae bacterium]
METSARTPRLILASASPRRQSLLSEAGYTFEVHPADVDERSAERPGILPADIVVYLAISKANAVREKFPDDVVLAADTVVAFGDQILGKPRDAQHARWMLSLLESTTHLVITGVAVVRHADGPDDAPRTARVMSAVRMRPLSADWINAYIAGGQWQGKAGGYGIQDNDPFVDRISGCHTNIVGLPMTTVKRMLAEHGIRGK